MKKKILKKLAYALCASTLIGNLFSLEVLANNNSGAYAIPAVPYDQMQIIDNTISEYDEKLDEDIEELVEKCENDGVPVSETTGTVQNDQGESFEIPMYEFNEVVCSTGNETVVANTYVYDLPDPEEVTRATTGNTNVNATDASSSIKGRLTIYYTYIYNADGLEFRRLTKVTGGYTIVDNAFSVASQRVEAIQFGVSPSGGTSESCGPFYPSSSSWSYNTGFSDSVSLSFDHQFGAKYLLTVKRQSSWTFEVRNFL